MNEPVFVRGDVPEALGPIAQSEPLSAVRLPNDLTAAIDAWAQTYEISRFESVRRLVELGLKAKGK